MEHCGLRPATWRLATVFLSNPGGGGVGRCVKLTAGTEKWKTWEKWEKERYSKTPKIGENSSQIQQEIYFLNFKLHINYLVILVKTWHLEKKHLEV